MAPLPHPLSALTVEESGVARDVVQAAYPNTLILFRQIFLREAPKSEVFAFLELEHSGKVTDSTPRPPRLAQVWFDVGGKDKDAEYVEAVVDIAARKITGTRSHGAGELSSLVMDEIREVPDACERSELFKQKLAEFELPDGFEAVVEPWPYGASDPTDDGTRRFQGIVYAVNRRDHGPDSNFYAYPIPLIPVMDSKTKEIVRVIEVATGGKDDPIVGATKRTNKKIIDHCRPAEYCPEKLPQGPRTDLKPLTVVQPEGASFSVNDGNRIDWQNWSMRLTFNPREGAVLHDIRFQGRSIVYRLSMSDMTVPYADPRSPFQRKQAFDFGDGGLGHAVNNLALGCDCLGVIQYFDGLVTNGNGSVETTENVICLHEQDGGIGWKHTDWRTGRAVVTRRRELVVQYIITLANYEYVFNFKFDQAGGITLETRATGIVSVVNIDPGKTAPWGNVVSPGALAQNHQHVFAARIDPAVDGLRNTLVQEESLPVKMNPATNPHGNYYHVEQTVIEKSAALDLAPEKHRVFKVQNHSKRNPVSGKHVGYKLGLPATQLLLADPDSVQAQRAQFAQHHLWVTKFEEDELYVGGRYPMQGRKEIGGVADAVKRGDSVQDEDLVLWAIYGLTHNPRVEDWPVMPVEVLEVHFSPSDFFTQNPAIDVPSNKDLGSWPCPV
ncbi:copper amine oxidase [Microdochium bolleyi]|uniref:Amine oxidase n=1 Tax=Microdochium bolleyi TaxID=196109 RepID=A0A136IZ40_9PEZI|nr:copper amine oxidase [Microdochium bolleyi]